MIWVRGYPKATVRTLNEQSSKLISVPYLFSDTYCTGRLCGILLLARIIAPCLERPSCYGRNLLREQPHAILVSYVTAVMVCSRLLNIDPVSHRLVGGRSGAGSSKNKLVDSHCRLLPVRLY